MSSTRLTESDGRELQAYKYTRFTYVCAYYVKIGDNGTVADLPSFTIANARERPTPFAF